MLLFVAAAHADESGYPDVTSRCGDWGDKAAAFVDKRNAAAAALTGDARKAPARMFRSVREDHCESPVWMWLFLPNGNEFPDAHGRFTSPEDGTFQLTSWKNGPESGTFVQMGKVTTWTLDLAKKTATVELGPNTLSCSIADYAYTPGRTADTDAWAFDVACTMRDIPTRFHFYVSPGDIWVEQRTKLNGTDKATRLFSTSH